MPSEDTTHRSVDTQDEYVGSFEVQAEFISTQQEHQQEVVDQPCVETEQPGEIGCKQCVTLKAKVVALQKTCSRLRGKLPAKGKLGESLVSPGPEDNNQQCESDSQPEDYSSETNEPPSHASFDTPTEESETSSQSSGEDSDDDNEKIR